LQWYIVFVYNRIPALPDDTMNSLEEGRELTLDFEKLQKIAKTGLPVIPVIVQHAKTKEVLVLAYTNKEAFDKTVETRIASFWSTSRNTLWVKGLTSGDFLDMVEIRVNCEQNSLLYLVLPKKEGVCHTKDAHGHTRKTCYYRKLEADKLSILPDAI
jgi:phosphoribosyl-AMP cyclohydrolase